MTRALKEEIDKARAGADEGKAIRIAVLYSMEYQGSFRDRLLAEGYRRSDERWYKAWSMNGRDTTSGEKMERRVDGEKR